MRKLILPLAIALFLQAQPPAKFALTVDNIMRGPGLVGYEPTQIRWSGDSSRIYFQWKRASQKEDAPLDTYMVDRDGSGLRKLSDDEAKMAPPAAGEPSPDHRLLTYMRDGDLFVYDNTNGKMRRLTATTEVEANPRFLRDGKRIAFTRANNLYVLSLEDASLVQMTDIRAEIPGAPAAGAAGGRGGRGGAPLPAPAGTPPPRGTDSQEFLKKEQKDLLETIRERAARREEEEARRKKENPRKPYMLQPRQTVTALQLSPDEKTVIATIVEAPANAKNTIVPSYVTESAYTEDIPGRSNVGDTQARLRLALIDAVTGDVKWADHGQKAPPSQAAQRT
jgi:hypothetical protein